MNSLFLAKMEFLIEALHPLYCNGAPFAIQNMNLLKNKFISSCGRASIVLFVAEGI